MFNLGRITIALSTKAQHCLHCIILSWNIFVQLLVQHLFPQLGYTYRDCCFSKSFGYLWKDGR